VEHPDPPPFDISDIASLPREKGVFGVYGDGSKVAVVACLPEEGGGCHEDALAKLKEHVAADTSLMKLVVVGIHTEAALAAGLSCAGYVINGSQHYEYTNDAGAVRRATFTKAAGGAWSVDDLDRAVADALKKAKTDQASGTASEPVGPAEPVGPSVGPAPLPESAPANPTT